MGRISRPQMFMEIAHIVAKRATCMRLSVGAVLVHQRNIVAIGYNGVPAGHEHCLGNDCPGKYKCELTTHAEMNALGHLPQWVSGPLDLYVTDSPCEDCYRALRVSPVHRIFFGTPYRITTHLEEKDDWFNGIYRITPSGYIMDWKTKELVEVVT